MKADERYGNAKLATIRRDFDKLRTAIRSHASQDAEDAWEKCERWLEAISPGVATRIAQLEAQVKAADALAEVARDLSVEAYGFDHLYETAFHGRVFESLEYPFATYTKAKESADG